MCTVSTYSDIMPSGHPPSTSNNVKCPIGWRGEGGQNKHTVDFISVRVRHLQPMGRTNHISFLSRNVTHSNGIEIHPTNLNPVSMGCSDHGMSKFSYIPVFDHLLLFMLCL